MRAYIRGVYGLPAALQRKTAEKAGCTAIYEDGVDPDARATWIRSFGISKDIAEPAWVMRLDVLALPKRRTGIGPAADLTDTLLSLLAKAKMVVEHESGYTSQHSREFKDRIKWARNYAARTQKVDVEQKRKAGRKGARAAKLASPVRLWKSDVMREEREAAALHWHDPRHQSAPEPWKAARAKLPAELRELEYTSLWRIFGAQDGVPKTKRKIRRGRPRGT